MGQARVIILNETKMREPELEKWVLCFQYCRYEYGVGEEENGYRFIWRRPNGNLQGARGQARIPSISDMMVLVSHSLAEGWGHHNCDTKGYNLQEE